MIIARRTLLVTILILSVASPGLAQSPGIQPFGNGVSISLPGSPPMTLQAFGEDVMINVPGQPPSVLRPTDTGGVLRLAGTGPITVQRAGTMVIISVPGAPPVTCTVSAGRLGCR